MFHLKIVYNVQISNKIIIYNEFPQLISIFLKGDGSVT